jgi:hypothetical protein
MPKKFIQRMVSFEEADYELVEAYARQLGLGRRSFSAALRQILREWQEGQEAAGGGAAEDSGREGEAAG